MPQRAKIRNGYLGRMALVMSVCFGFALWCVFDALVTYPKQSVRANKYLEFKHSDRPEWEHEWYDYAKEQGWRTVDPGEDMMEKIFGQYIMAGFMSSVGLIFLTILLLNRGRWIEADETGFSTSWGLRCEFDSISGLNKKKWQNKGIAVVLYEQDGRTKRLVLDDCKYDVEPTEAFLQEVESRLSDEQIIGGRREPPPKQEDDPSQADAGESPSQDEQATE